MPKTPYKRRKGKPPNTRTNSDVLRDACKARKPRGKAKAQGQAGKLLGVGPGAVTGGYTSTGVCIACEGSGEDSRGWPCFPCSGVGRKYAKAQDKGR